MESIKIVAFHCTDYYKMLSNTKIRWRMQFRKDMFSNKLGSLL